MTKPDKDEPVLKVNQRQDESVTHRKEIARDIAKRIEKGAPDQPVAKPARPKPNKRK